MLDVGVIILPMLVSVIAARARRTGAASRSSHSGEIALAGSCHVFQACDSASPFCTCRLPTQDKLLKQSPQVDGLFKTCRVVDCPFVGNMEEISIHSLVQLTVVIEICTSAAQCK